MFDPVLLAALSGTTFSPRTLFAGGEQGAWYDPSDFIPNWRRNLLTRSEEFDNAAWVKSATTVTANTVVAPNGTTTADKLTEDATTAPHRVQQAYNMTVGASHTLSVFAKAGERNWIQILTNSFSGGNQAANFNLSNGTVGTGASGANLTKTIVSVGSGWYLCTITWTPDATGSNVYFYVLDSDAATGASYTGNGTSGIFIWGAQLELGSSATPYQKITDGVADYFTYQPQPVMFQDSAGTTPVTAVEQPVGLILDKSKGLAIGAELTTPSSGPYGSLPSWAASVNGSLALSSGAVRSTAPGGTASRLEISFSVISGMSYSITAQMNSNFGIVPVAFVNVSPSDFTVPSSGQQAIRANLRATATGTATLRFYPRSSTGASQVSGDFVEFSSFSVRELPGNHASQATSASRPVLRARVNLLTYSEQFDNAAWTKTNSTVTPNVIAGPTGATTADILIPSAVNAQHRVDQVTTSAAVPHTFSVYAKNAGYNFIWVRIGSNGAYFDLTTGATSGITGGLTATCTSQGNGWFLCTVSGTTALNDTVRINAIAVALTSDFIGDGTSGVYLWGADLRVTNDGVGIPAYQRINAATDYDTTGFPLYLAFDGVDDSLATASINFSATDKMTVFAGVRKLSDAATSLIVESGIDSSSASSSFGLMGPTVGGSNKYVFNSSGSAGPSVPFTTSTTFNAPVTSVLTGLGDISGDGATLRINGVVINSSGTDQGTGNYAAASVFIGRRNSTSIPFNGRIYSIIVRGASTNADQLARAEAWVNNITKAY